MVYTKEDHIMRKLFLFIIIFVFAFDVVGQHMIHSSKHHFYETYYQIVHFSDDSLVCDYGNGHLVQERVIPYDFEEEKCAYLGNFSVDISERCNWIRFVEEGKEFVRLTVRCQFGNELNFITFPTDLDSSKIVDSLCMSLCDDLYFPIEGDSVATILWDVMPSINVYQLKLKGRRAYLNHFIGETNKCGLFELVIPTDRDSYYGFYMAEDYIVWLHFGCIPPQKNSRVKKNCFQSSVLQ